MAGRVRSLIQLFERLNSKLKLSFIVISSSTEIFFISVVLSLYKFEPFLEFGCGKILGSLIFAEPAFVVVLKFE